MSKGFRSLTLTLLLLFGLNSFAQKLTSFTPDSIRFIKELDEYFQYASADKSEAATFIKEFEKAWKAPTFTIEYKDYVYTTCNRMLEKKLKPTPFFKDYLTAVVSFIDAQHQFINFINWQICIDKGLKPRSSRAVGDFLEMSLNLFEENVFYKSPTFSWYSNINTYKFDYDTLPKLIFNNIVLTGKNPRTDSISIEQTSGVYYPSIGKFYGRGGRVS